MRAVGRRAPLEYAPAGERAELASGLHLQRVEGCIMRFRGGYPIGLLGLLGICLLALASCASPGGAAASQSPDRFSSLPNDGGTVNRSITDSTPNPGRGGTFADAIPESQRSRNSTGNTSAIESRDSTQPPVHSGSPGMTGLFGSIAKGAMTAVNLFSHYLNPGKDILRPLSIDPKTTAATVSTNCGTGAMHNEAWNFTRNLHLAQTKRHSTLDQLAANIKALPLQIKTLIVGAHGNNGLAGAIHGGNACSFGALLKKMGIERVIFTSCSTAGGSAGRAFLREVARCSGAIAIAATDTLYAYPNAIAMHQPGRLIAAVPEFAPHIPKTPDQLAGITPEASPGSSTNAGDSSRHSYSPTYGVQ